VASHLGAISHALTAAEALAARTIPLGAVIVSESEASTVALDDTVESMGRFLPGVRLMVLPRLRAAAEPWRAAPDLTGALA
jgi:dethiobiotin synthetase